LRAQDGGRTLLDAQLLIEAEEPALDRAGADAQRLRDLVVGQPAPQEREQARVRDLEAEAAGQLLGDLVLRATGP